MYFDMQGTALSCINARPLNGEGPPERLHVPWLNIPPSTSPTGHFFPSRGGSKTRTDPRVRGKVAEHDTHHRELMSENGARARHAGRRGLRLAKSRAGVARLSARSHRRRSPRARNTFGGFRNSHFRTPSARPSPIHLARPGRLGRLLISRLPGKSSAAAPLPAPQITPAPGRPCHALRRGRCSSRVDEWTSDRPP
jgi:hypothetical protein